MITKGKAGDSIHAAFILQEGVADTHARDFTAGQLDQAARIGDELAGFIDAAKFSLHMAIYDFRLDGAAADKVIGALNAKAEAGVTVRIAYFQPPRQPTPDAFALLGSDPAQLDDGLALGTRTLHERVQVKPIKQDPNLHPLAPPVQGEPITAPHNLMHSKYIVRDGITPQAAVLTGAANFTTDAWAVQDNNIVIFDPCPDLARYYENDFGEMWQAEQISNTGNFDTGTVEIGGVAVQVLFAPGRGRQIGAEIASRIDVAEKRLLIASMDISSGPILGAIADRMHRVATFGGIYDGPQMHLVLQEWEKSKGAGRGGARNPSRRRAGASAGKATQFEQIAEFLHYKKSLPFKSAGVHNFMHNKFAVVDDTVITGSFNFSTNAQRNAENVVIVESADLADAYADYANALLAKYPDTGVD